MIDLDWETDDITYVYPLLNGTTLLPAAARQEGFL